MYLDWANSCFDDINDNTYTRKQHTWSIAHRNAAHLTFWACQINWFNCSSGRLKVNLYTIKQHSEHCAQTCRPSEFLSCQINWGNRFSGGSKDNPYIKKQEIQHTYKETVHPQASTSNALHSDSLPSWWATLPSGCFILEQKFCKASCPFETLNDSWIVDIHNPWIVDICNHWIVDICNRRIVDIWAEAFQGIMYLQDLHLSSCLSLFLCLLLPPDPYYSHVYVCLHVCACVALEFWHSSHDSVTFLVCFHAFPLE